MEINIDRFHQKQRFIHTFWKRSDSYFLNSQTIKVVLQVFHPRLVLGYTTNYFLKTTICVLCWKDRLWQLMHRAKLSPNNRLCWTQQCQTWNKTEQKLINRVKEHGKDYKSVTKKQSYIQNSTPCKPKPDYTTTRIWSLNLNFPPQLLVIKHQTLSFLIFSVTI